MNQEKYIGMDVHDASISLTPKKANRRRKFALSPDCVTHAVCPGLRTISLTDISISDISVTDIW